MENPIPRSVLINSLKKLVKKLIFDLTWGGPLGPMGRENMDGPWVGSFDDSTVGSFVDSTVGSFDDSTIGSFDDSTVGSFGAPGGQKSIKNHQKSMKN